MLIDAKAGDVHNRAIFVGRIQESAIRAWLETIIRGQPSEHVTTGANPVHDGKHAC